jgi:FkbM family methyltransferase
VSTKDRRTPHHSATYRAGPIATARMSLGHNLLLDLRAPAQRTAYSTGSFDDDLLVVARALLDRSGAVAVDVGANIGLWTAPLATRAAEVAARVLAFEPVPANAQRLRQNLELNGVEGIVTVEEVALSDAEGTLRMALREDFAAGAATGNASVTIPDGEDVAFAQVEARRTRLDTAVDLAADEHVPVMKIDAEGHEDRILTGARDTLGRQRPVVFIEWNAVYHQRRGTDQTAAITEAIEGLGYTTLRRIDGAWQRVTTFASPRELDDLVLVPMERTDDVLDRLRAVASS